MNKRVKCFSLILLIPLLMGCFAGCSLIQSLTGKQEQEPTAEETLNTLESAVETAETTAVSEELPVPQPPKITVACIGDSITEGIGVEETLRATQSYPAQLQALLGSDYEVLNYGKSGATLCSLSHSFYQQKAWITYSGYRAELKNRAADIDVALIMLGTNEANSDVFSNDSLLKNNRAAIKEDYKNNLKILLNILKRENPDVVIYLLNAPKSYRADKPQWEVNLQVIRSIQQEVARELAEEFGLILVDMYQYSAERMSADDFSDGMHPNEKGYAKLAEKAKELVKQAENGLPKPPADTSEDTTSAGGSDGTDTPKDTSEDTATSAPPSTSEPPTFKPFETAEDEETGYGPVIAPQ